MHAAPRRWAAELDGRGAVLVFSTMIQKLRSSRLARAVATDSGVAGVLLVSVIAIVAFNALSVFLNKYIGDRAFERARGASAGQGLVLGSVMAYYYQQTPTHTLPCPDTTATPDGVADACQVSGTTTGVVNRAGRKFVYGWRAQIGSESNSARRGS